MAQKRNKNKKWIYWALILVLLVAAGVVAYLVWDNYFRDKGENTESNIVEIIEKDENNEDVDDNDGGVEKEKVVLYEGEDPNKKEELTGVVTYAGISGESLVIRVNIDQYLDSGKCELSLAAGDNSVYIDTANIVDSAATATCEGFNVPVNALGAGNYQIIIKISSGGKFGTINGEVNI